MSSARAEQATAAVLAALGAFQVALAAGAPWGRAAYGGSHRGVLSPRLRVTSGVAAVGYGAAAAVMLRGKGSDPARRVACTVLSLLLGAGAVANAASRSPVERAVWTPVTMAGAISAWRSRPACPS